MKQGWDLGAVLLGATSLMVMALIVVLKSTTLTVLPRQYRGSGTSAIPKTLYKNKFQSNYIHFFQQNHFISTNERKKQIALVALDNNKWLVSHNKTLFK